MSKKPFLCRLGLHKWAYVKEAFYDNFLGETIKQYYTRFRICERCGRVEELLQTYDSAEWFEISKVKADILKKKIRKAQDFYVVEEGRR